MAFDGSFCLQASPHRLQDATPFPMYLGVSPQLEPTTTLLKTLKLQSSMLQNNLSLKFLE